MPVYSFEEKRPKIPGSTFIHEAATIIGNVSVGESCFIGSGAVIRGDYGAIEIGDRTSIQENAVLHARVEEKCSVGREVQVGHGAILHNCTVEDFAVVGLGSRICDYALIGRWSIVGEGSVVTSRSRIPDEKVAVGVPARVIRDVTAEDKRIWGFYKEKYVELAARYRSGLRRIS